MADPLPDWPPELLAAQRRRFVEDGVIKLPALLGEDSLAAARRCYEWSLVHPGPNGAGGNFLQPSSDETFEDKANPDAPAVYGPWLRKSNLAATALALWGTAADAWFMYEQVFRKSGACRRTCWHQDSSYLAVEGNHLIVFWISFAAVPARTSLEFVRGSHRGPLYNGSTFNEDDPTEPIYPTDALPRLPNVDADRAAFDIVQFAVEPGDVVAFHPRVLHGGAGTDAADLRETLSIRLFGSDATYAERPGPCGPRVAGFHDGLRTGDAFRHPAFLELA